MYVAYADQNKELEKIKKIIEYALRMKAK